MILNTSRMQKFKFSFCIQKCKLLNLILFNYDCRCYNVGIFFQISKEFYSSKLYRFQYLHFTMVTVYYPHRLREKPLGVHSREARVLVLVQEVEVLVAQYSRNLPSRRDPSSSSSRPECRSSSLLKQQFLLNLCHSLCHHERHLSGSELIGLISSVLSVSWASRMSFLFLLAAQAVSVASVAQHWVVEDNIEVATKNNLPFLFSLCLVTDSIFLCIKNHHKLMTPVLARKNIQKIL